MDFKNYLKVSAANAVFLLAGLLAGILLTGRLSPTIAQANQPQAEAPKQPPVEAKKEEPKPPPEDPCCEWITPTMGAGAIATNTLLANRVAGDKVYANSFDVLLLHQGILNALGAHGILSPAEIRKIADDAKNAKPLRVRQR